MPIYGPAPIKAISLGGNTSGTMSLVSSGTVSLMGGPNITLSQSGNTISISAAAGGAGGADVMSHYDNAFDLISVSQAHQHGSFFVFPLDPIGGNLPAAITVSSMLFDMSYSSANVSAALTMSTKVGLYTRNGASLSLLNSGIGSYTQPAAAGNSSMVSGIRWGPVTSWSSANALPASQQVFVGVAMFTSGGPGGVNMLGQRMFQSNSGRWGQLGVGSGAANTAYGWYPWVGVSAASLATNAALPTSIGTGTLVKTGALYGFVPHIILNNVSSQF